MKRRYVAAMAALHRFCLVLCGVCLVVISVIIPWGVYTRYVLGYGSSWPEPMAILLMLIVSFLSSAVCYRDNVHISVRAVPNALGAGGRLLLGWVVEACMAAMMLFMLVWGVELVETTWYQVIAEFPVISVGLSYLPLPVAGAVTLLFVVERLWTGALFAPPVEGGLGESAE